MNKALPLLSLLLFLLTSLFSSFQQRVPPPEVNPKQMCSDRLSIDIDKFFGQMSEVNVAWQEYLKNEQTLKHLRKQFSELRMAYKRIEFMAQYREPEYIKLFINGAPLPKHNPATEAAMVVEDPNGLQTLDELLFSENPLEEKEKITDLLSKLSNDMIWFKGLNKVALSDREIFEASRLSLVRTFTLGLTGFDCPGSVNSIKEASVVLSSIESAMLPYTILTSKSFRKNAKNIQALFTDAQEYLAKHTDFDSFDRLAFLTNFFNPLYAGLLNMQEDLGIEHKNARQSALQPWVSTSRNLFEEGFLNKYYYTGLLYRENKEELVSLGRMLFFDPVLSSSNDRSCASCHDPKLAFTDGKAKSIATGFNGTLERNAPTCIDAVYADRYFHDLRADVLEDQIEHVVYSDKEFNTSYEEISGRLMQSEEYRSLFMRAFPEIPTRYIQQGTIANALAAYVASLTSFNSPFDRYVRGESKSVSAEVRNGFNLFMGKAACGTCHFAPVFNGLVPPNYIENESEVIGVPQTKDTIQPKLDPDLGRAKAKVNEQLQIYAHAFKTPTVRNVALTAPYMHNGVYETLEEVMDFYNKGGGVGLGIDIPNQTLPFDNLNLNTNEIIDIIAFMKTLTDTTGLTRIPERLPTFQNVSLNNRKIGGVY